MERREKMPGNVIKINDSGELLWYVGDSEMGDLVKFLNEVGYKIREKQRRVVDKGGKKLKEIVEELEETLEDTKKRLKLIKKFSSYF